MVSRHIETACGCIKMDFDSSKIIAENCAFTPISNERHYEAYADFATWKISKNTKSNSQTVLLAYFYEISKRLVPSSLWAHHSMLKNTIKVKDNIDIGEYHQLTGFLKAKSRDYNVLKAKVFGDSEVKRFVSEAPDYLWLDVKVRTECGLERHLSDFHPILSRLSAFSQFVVQ